MLRFETQCRKNSQVLCLFQRTTFIFHLQDDQTSIVQEGLLDALCSVKFRINFTLQVRVYGQVEVIILSSLSYISIIEGRKSCVSDLYPSQYGFCL